MFNNLREQRIYVHIANLILAFELIYEYVDECVWIIMWISLDGELDELRLSSRLVTLASSPSSHHLTRPSLSSPSMWIRECGLLGDESRWRVDYL